MTKKKFNGTTPLLLGPDGRPLPHSVNVTQHLKFHYVFYRLLLQSMIADFVQVSDDETPEGTWRFDEDGVVPTTDAEIKPRVWEWSVWRRWKRNHAQTEPVELPSPEPRLSILLTHSGKVYELTVGETKPLILDKVGRWVDANY
jgi:hypothetical protein